MPRRDVYERATHTRAIVSFHSDTSFDGVVRGKHPDIGHIVGVTTSKSLGEASGTFAITIKKPEWLHRTPLTSLGLFRDPEDTWVWIQFVCDGQVFDTMFGLVDSINEDVTRSGDGARSETYTITGRDFGKVFEVTQIFVNLFDPSVSRSFLAYKSFMEEQGAFLGAPDKLVRALIDAWIGNRGLADGPWRLPRSLGSTMFNSLLDMLELNTIQLMGDENGKTFAPQLLTPGQGGSLWDSMQEYSNGVMNELFVDLAQNIEDPGNSSNLVPAVYLRERCFKTRGSRVNWDRLPKFVLSGADVQHRQVAVGGAANRYNYWTIGIPGFQGNQFATAKLLQEAYGSAFGRPGSVPIINNESIRQHGLRKWEGETNYLLVNDPAAGRNWLGVGANWLARIHDWYAPAPMQRSGSITTTRVMPEIRIGKRVVEKRPEGNIQFYVEGVTHDWQYPGAGRTTLTVTRGEYDDEDLLNFVYQDYDRADAVQSITTAQDELQGGLPEALVVETDATGDLSAVAAAAAAAFLRPATPGEPGMLPIPTEESSQAALLAAGVTQDALPPVQPLPGGVLLNLDALGDPEALWDDPLAGLDEEEGLP